MVNNTTTMPTRQPQVYQASDRKVTSQFQKTTRRTWVRMLHNLGDYAGLLTVNGQGWYNDWGVAIVPIRFSGTPNTPFLLTVGDGWVYSHNLKKQIPIRKRFKGDYNGPKSLANVFLEIANTLNSIESRENRKREVETRLRSVFPQAFTATPPESVVLRVPIDPKVYTPEIEKALQDLFLKLVP